MAEKPARQRKRPLNFDVTPMNALQNVLRTLTDFFVQSWGQLVWVFLLYILSKLVLRRLVSKCVFYQWRSRDRHRKQRRAQTLRGVLVTLGNTVIYAIILFMLLISASTQSLLTGAGVIGLAVGFGSQALVRDFMSGILVLYEGQYSVGDKVKIGGFEGTVKKLRCVPRCWKARMGSRLYISNGSVNNVVNLSQNAKNKP